jgi:hypothetical protein
MSGSRRSVLQLGTRGSALALAQTEWVAQRLRTAGMEVRIVPVRTVGDTCSAPVTDIGVGVFVLALREALWPVRSTRRCIPTRICRPQRIPGWYSPPYRNARIRAMRWWPGTGWC